MKKHILLITLVLQAGFIFSQNFDFQGTINENTSWNYDTIFVTGDITVPDGITLNIAAGSVLEFQAYYKLSVHGCLRAIGEPENEIRFTVADTTGFADTTHFAGARDALEFTDISETNDSSVLSYCILEYGKARGQTHDDKSGGSLFIDNSSKIRISNCIIQHNIAIYYGGGIYIKNNASPLIENCTIRYNRSYSVGGAISTDEYCNPLIKNNIIHYNSAYSQYYSDGMTVQRGAGGAIHISTVYGTGPRIENNYICNNVSYNGIVYDSSPHSVVIGNIICNNNGSGIFNGHQLSHSEYINNTIFNNYDDGPNHGIVTYASNIKVENNILWHNASKYGEGEIDGNNIIDINYNNIENGYHIGENISIFPNLTEPTEGRGVEYDALHADWSLKDDSPCVNAGRYDTTGLNLPILDILYNPRIFGGRIDIGALENQHIVSSVQNFESKNSISLYPNPCRHMVFITSEMPITAISISDMQGKICYSRKYSSSQTKEARIDCSQLEPGSYIVKLRSQDYTFSKKLMKR